MAIHKAVCTLSSSLLTYSQASDPHLLAQHRCFAHLTSRMDASRSLLLHSEHLQVPGSARTWNRWHLVCLSNVSGDAGCCHTVLAMAKQANKIHRPTHGPQLRPLALIPRSNFQLSPCRELGYKKQQEVIAVRDTPTVQLLAEDSSTETGARKNPLGSEMPKSHKCRTALTDFSRDGEGAPAVVTEVAPLSLSGNTAPVWPSPLCA